MLTFENPFSYYLLLYVVWLTLTEFKWQINDKQPLFISNAESIQMGVGIGT